MAKKLEICKSRSTNYINFKWGVIIEYITTKFISQYLSVYNNVIELGSVPGPIFGQRYSPDGITIVEDNEGIEHIVLIEIKSPITRTVKTTIPSYYLPQIKTGLCTLPICEYGLFLDINYKFSTYYEIQKKGHYDYPINNLKIENEAACYGVIKFYIKQKFEKELDKKFIKSLFLKNKLRDLVKMGTSYIEKIFDLFYDDYLTIKCSPICIHKPEYILLNGQDATIDYIKNIKKKELDKFIANDNNDCIGYMGWKMFNCLIKKINKDSLYLKKNNNKISKFIEELEYYNNIKNKDEMKKKFITKYPYTYKKMEDMIKDSEEELVELMKK